VYSFGIVMFEVYAGQMAFQGANLGHLIFQIGVSLSSVSASCIAPCTHEATHRESGNPVLSLLPATTVHKRERPPIPEGCPQAYSDLMCACWQHEPSDRSVLQAG
jgi:Protein tyrosine and serine/threonine kinase